MSSKFHYGWIILFMGLMIVMAALGFARFGYTMILPSMKDGLELSRTDAGALATGNFVGYLSLALIGGFLASHFSPRRVISISLFAVGGFMILTGFSSGYASALIWRTLTGMGSGGANVPVMGLMAAWFASKRRGLATGIAVSGSSLALILTGKVLPPILTLSSENGWRYSWFFLGGLVLLVGVAAYLLLRDRPEEKGLRPIGAEDIQDPPSAPKTSAPKSKSWGLVYKSGIVWHLAMIYAAFGFSYIIYITFFSVYLTDEIGVSIEGAGYLWGIVGWISILCGILWGWISDWIGRKYALALVFFLQGCAYAGFAIWTSSLGLMVSAVVFGITAWSIPAIMASTCGDRLGSRLASAALGFVTLFMGIGQALGPYVGGKIADQSETFVPSFLTAMGAAFIGTILSLLLKSSSGSDAKET